MWSSNVHGMVVVKVDTGLFLWCTCHQSLGKQKIKIKKKENKVASNEKGRFCHTQSYLCHALIYLF